MVTQKNHKLVLQVLRVNRYATVLVMLLLVILTACTSSTATPTTVPLTALPTVHPDVFFPKQDPVEGEREMLEALLIGDLVVIDKSLYVISSHAHTNFLPIWPSDYNLDTSSEPYQILDGDGVVVARVGDEVSIGGGEINTPPGFRESIQVNIPEDYSGLYWWVGKVVDSHNNSE